MKKSVKFQTLHRKQENKLIIFKAEITPYILNILKLVFKITFFVTNIASFKVSKQMPSNGEKMFFQEERKLQHITMRPSAVIFQYCAK